MPEIKVVHTCSHAIMETHERERSKTIAKSNGLDVIPSEHPVKAVSSIIQGSSTYESETDFIAVGRNFIRWISDNVPAVGSEITVHYVELAANIISYAPQECMKCSGRGWYVGIRNDESNKIEYVQGIDRIVQDYLKILLTYIGENRFDTTYGSELLDLPTKNIPAVEIQDRVSVVLKECEIKLREIQSNNLSSLPEGEILKRIDIKSISYDSANKRIFVSIRVVSQANDEVEYDFGI